MWLLVIQCVTGLMLMATYSPSMTSAWASVQFIDQTAAGRFLRGIHHFASHALIVLLVVHVARVLLTGAFRAPRELVWITGLLLIPLVVIWTITGNPLSGSQKGLAQIQVEGNILRSTPIVGPLLQHVLIGGDEVGNLTLTHLYFLHVGLLPLLVGGLCALHLHQIFKHSQVSDSRTNGSTTDCLPYWPYQTVRNLTVLAACLAVISFFAWKYGAPLDFPADPNLPLSPRPEWYFRWLFELRRHFTGDSEFVATMLLPGAILAFFVAVPFLDLRMSRWMSMAFRVVVVAGSIGGWSWLTLQSFSRDWRDPEFLAAQEQSHDLTLRALELAQKVPISVEGAAELLRDDPQTQGPLLFAQHCAGCHSHTAPNGEGIAAAEPSAPNLYRFGTQDWILGLLDPVRIASSDYFGMTKFREGDMSSTIHSLFDDAGDDGAAELREKLSSVAAALAAEGGDSTIEPNQVERGRELLTGELSCTDCHRFGDAGELGSAPDLTGYGSAEWLAGMIGDPTGDRFYAGDHNDRMPKFAEHTQPELNLLSPNELDLLVRWLRREAPMQNGDHSPATSPRAAAVSSR